MGDVLRVKFWQDVCCGVCPLIETFPNLYCIAMAKNVFVLDYLRTVNLDSGIVIGGWR